MSGKSSRSFTGSGSLFIFGTPSSVDFSVKESGLLLLGGETDLFSESVRASFPDPMSTSDGEALLDWPIKLILFDSFIPESQLPVEGRINPKRQLIGSKVSILKYK